MKFIVLATLLCALLFCGSSSAKEFSSIAEGQANVLLEKKRETLSCLESSVEKIAGNTMPMSRALAEGIVESHSIAPVLADAALFAGETDRSLDHMEKLDPAGQVQLAFGSLAMVYANHEIESWIRFGAEAALLIHSAEATNGSCVAANQLKIVYLIAISTLRDSDDDLVFDGREVPSNENPNCERYDLQAKVLPKSRYLVDEVEIDHDELVRIIESRRDASSHFRCLKVFSEQGGVPEERILALSELGMHITWNRVGPLIAKRIQNR